MLESLRQVAFLVRDLPDASALYQRILGLDPSVGHDLPEYGLTNLMLPTGAGTFVELLQPDTTDSAAARFLQRRGEAPYLLAFETKDYDRLIPRLRSLGVRITAETAGPDSRSAFVHPASANGAFLEITEVTAPNNPWPAGGPDWFSQDRHPKTKQLRQVAVLVRDLDQAVHRWSEMFGIQATRRFQVSFTELEIAVLPLNGRDTFVELAQPLDPDTPSARFLERYGEGIYLTIFEIDDSLAVDAYLQDQSIRFTTSRATANYVNLGFNSIWLHPSSMKGAFIQLSQVLHPENPWPPAGDDWYLTPGG